MLYCTNKIDLPCWKTNTTVWFYCFLMLKPTFLLYCTKKTNHFSQKCCTVPKNKKKNVSRPLAKDQPGSGQLSWPQDQETYAFLVQYSTFGQKACFFWYSTAKMKVWASKTTKTIRFYWFLKMSEPFYWYSTAKMKLCIEKITKTLCFYWFL